MTTMPSGQSIAQSGVQVWICKGRILLKRLQLHPASTDYTIWRQHFFFDRLSLCLWIAVSIFLVSTTANFLQVFSLTGQELEKQITLFHAVGTGSLLLLCLVLHRTPWGQRYPSLAFLGLSWSTMLMPQYASMLLHLPGIVDGSWLLIFLSQAILLPVRWRLHLLSQLSVILHSIGINLFLGFRVSLFEHPVFVSDSPIPLLTPHTFILLFWVCLVCDLAVYLYERLQQKEFESRRQLRMLLHSVSHDLKTPVLGTAIVLQSLIAGPGEEVTFKKSELRRLLEGNDRQLTLIHSLLETHAAEVSGIALRCEQLQLRTVVDAVLTDLVPSLTKHQITLTNCVSSTLPWVQADAIQLQRVLSNLISNAVKHNPPGIHLIVNAALVRETTQEEQCDRLNRRKARKQAHLIFWPIRPRRQRRQPPLQPTAWLRCTVQDDGIGIPLQQQAHLFELYFRGSQARFMPGLGLGLYLCKQIIAAHGGQIGVLSRPGEGTTFWFTLPLPAQCNDRNQF